jgi:arylsulfotransferase ASST
MAIVSRRDVFRIAGGSLAAGGTVVPAAAQPAAPLDGIEPNTIKRRGLGFRGIDKARAYTGFTLFAPIAATNRTVYLIDMEGKVVHHWQMPYPPGLHGYLTERGTLFFNGKIPNESHLGKTPFMGGSVMEVDWNGTVLWEVKHPEHHHDGIRLRNGNVMLICARELAPEIARRVRGGRAGSEYDGGRMNADYLLEMTTGGKVVWEWRVADHLDPEKDHITGEQDPRDEWTHANGLSEMLDGNILLSCRNTSTVMMIDRKTGDISWKLGPPPLSGQHAPYLLENGHVLLFDNGPHRLDETFPYSRVLEIDPATKAIVWKFQESPVQNFFSDRISNAVRLRNGNTLINEGVFGRFFEVTPDGHVVWEYVNPFFGGPVNAQTNAVFRVQRYSEAEIERARRAR